MATINEDHGHAERRLRFLNHSVLNIQCPWANRVPHTYLPEFVGYVIYMLELRDKYKYLVNFKNFKFLWKKMQFFSDHPLAL